MADFRRIFGPRLPKKDGFVLIGGELPKLIILRFQLLDLTFARKTPASKIVQCTWIDFFGLTHLKINGSAIQHICKMCKALFVK